MLEKVGGTAIDTSIGAFFRRWRRGTAPASLQGMASENHGEVTALYRALIDQAHRLIAAGKIDAAVLTLRDAISFAPDRDEAARLLRGVLGRA